MAWSGMDGFLPGELIDWLNLLHLFGYRGPVAANRVATNFSFALMAGIAYDSRRI